MFIQSIDNTNFGKIGKAGGKALGRGKKSRTLVHKHITSSKLNNNDKAQMKQIYNSDTSIGDFDDICEKFMERTNFAQDKFIRRK